METFRAPPEEYAVTGVTDALAVRDVLPENRPLLILYPHEAELAPLLTRCVIDVAISSVAWVEAAAAFLRRGFTVDTAVARPEARLPRGCRQDMQMSSQRRLGVHLFVDTGHARAGATPAQSRGILAAVLRHEDLFEVRGFMSHFCCDLLAPKSSVGTHGPIDILRKAGLRLRRGWSEADLRREAAHVHDLQKKRVDEVFAQLSAQLEEHRRHIIASGLNATEHRASRHVAASSALLNGETDVFYDMVRAGTALYLDLPGSCWPGRPQDRCIVEALGGCRDGARVQAIKRLPGRPHAPWCLYYGCLMGPVGASLPFRVEETMRVAALSGVCHEEALPYGSVHVPLSRDGRGARALLEVGALGDGYGTVVLLPSQCMLNGTANLFPLSWGRLDHDSEGLASSSLQAKDMGSVPELGSRGRDTLDCGWLIELFGKLPSDEQHINSRSFHR
eukprot:TRINITY_DN69768_c0_g1_i1.p1 TRINITY_DN69768_c0_g1~~TRINITY_DN69768_c0_g1_i1.p1  ORF type:complete len:484 (+),score=68.99 TRINITY_DN69768_c0_g1_i1:109-1452(+)